MYFYISVFFIYVICTFQAVFTIIVFFLLLLYNVYIFLSFEHFSIVFYMYIFFTAVFLSITLIFYGPCIVLSLILYDLYFFVNAF